MFNFFEELEDEKYGNLETYVLVKSEIIDEKINLIYIKENLKYTSKEKIEEFKQLRLL